MNFSIESLLKGIFPPKMIAAMVIKQIEKDFKIKIESCQICYDAKASDLYVKIKDQKLRMKDGDQVKALLDKYAGTKKDRKLTAAWLNVEGKKYEFVACYEENGKNDFETTIL